jgi:hypothetical protein
LISPYLPTPCTSVSPGTSSSEKWKIWGERFSRNSEVYRWTLFVHRRKTTRKENRGDARAHLSGEAPEGGLDEQMGHPEQRSRCGHGGMPTSPVVAAAASIEQREKRIFRVERNSCISFSRDERNATVVGMFLLEIIFRG